MNQLIATVKNGELRYSEAQSFDFLKHNEGKRVLLTLEPYTGVKTQNQLGYFFAAIVTQVAKDNGWDKDELYLHLMEQCNKRRSTDPKTGEIRMIPAGLSHCRDKWEMASVIDKCCFYLSTNFGYHVHTPDEYYRGLERMAESEIPVE